MHCCPRDKSVLGEKVIRGDVVFHCGGCAGLWLPHSFVFHAGGREFTPFRVNPGKLTRMHCPKDGSLLMAVRHRGIEIDLCNACGGVWVDRGELEQILELGRKSSAAMPLASHWDGSGIGFVGEGICTVVEFVLDALSGW